MPLASPLYCTGHQIGPVMCGKFSCHILFSLAMATKMVTAWRAAREPQKYKNQEIMRTRRTTETMTTMKTREPRQNYKNRRTKTTTRTKEPTGDSQMENNKKHLEPNRTTKP